MNKNEKYKYTFFTLLWVIGVVFVLLVQSCKSKKKLTDRERTKTETQSLKTVNQLQENNLQLNEVTHIGSGTITISNIKEIELEQDKSGNPITIIDEKGNKISFKGVKSAKIKTHSTKETKADTTAKKLSVNDQSKIAKKGSSQTHNKSESKKRNSNSDVKTTSTWFWWLLGVIAVLVGGYYYKKKGGLLFFY